MTAEVVSERRGPPSRGSSGGDNVICIDKEREKIFFSSSNDWRSLQPASALSRAAASSLWVANQSPNGRHISPIAKGCFFPNFFRSHVHTRAKQFRDIFGGINSLKLRSGFINICNSILVVTVRVHTL